MGQAGGMMRQAGGMAGQPGGMMGQTGAGFNFGNLPLGVDRSAVLGALAAANVTGKIYVVLYSVERSVAAEEI